MAVTQEVSDGILKKGLSPDKPGFYIENRGGQTYLGTLDPIADKLEYLLDKGVTVHYGVSEHGGFHVEIFPLEFRNY